MPTLHWIGKEKVVSHHQDVPFRVMEHTYGFSEGKEQKTSTDSGNKIIHGDNLEALKSFLPEYEGKIKCIYIDPPYNTGKESWIYNDKVDHPKIKKWLGEVVGKEEEDLTRHDKWLCMMYPRLKLLHKMLKNQDGIIFVSIDENEYHHLRILMNEIFGKNHYAGEFIWNTRHSQQQGLIAAYHEYIVVYTKCPAKQFPNFNAEGGDIIAGAIKKISKSNPASNFVFPAGIRCEANNGTEFKGIWGDVEKMELVAGTFKVYEQRTTNEMTLRAGWTQKEQMIKLYNSNDPVFDTKGQRVKEFYFTSTGKLKSIKERSKITPSSILDEFGTVSNATKELANLLGHSKFGQPKPYKLISHLISLSTNENDIILDSFAGSGTTAHAVLNLNKQDGGNRKFILIEMEEYANSITAERVKRVINGYGDTEGTGGSFDFYELGKPLFVGENKEFLNEEIDTEKIREYIWYSETRVNYTKPTHGLDTEYFLGKKEETAYYFFYDKEGLTTLDYDSLALIKNKSDQYIIYADNCLLPQEFMLQYNIVFKKIPRDITRF